MLGEDDDVAASRAKRGRGRPRHGGRRRLARPGSRRSRWSGAAVRVHPVRDAQPLRARPRARPRRPDRRARRVRGRRGAARRRRPRERPPLSQQRLARRSTRSSCTAASATAGGATPSRGCGRSHARARTGTTTGSTLDGEPLDARIVLVSNNAYTLTLLSVGERERLDEGLLLPLCADRRAAPAMGGASGERFTIDAQERRPARGPRSTASPRSSTLPIEFTIEPRALRVLLPRGPGA